jgi:hypothetical protein
MSLSPNYPAEFQQNLNALGEFIGTNIRLVNKFQQVGKSKFTYLQPPYFDVVNLLLKTLYAGMSEEQRRRIPLKTIRKQDLAGAMVAQAKDHRLRAEHTRTTSSNSSEVSKSPRRIESGRL